MKKAYINVPENVMKIVRNYKPEDSEGDLNKINPISYRTQLVSSSGPVTQEKTKKALHNLKTLHLFDNVLKFTLSDYDTEPIIKQLSKIN